MPVKKYLNKLELTHPKYLQTLVENRRLYNLNNCELNVFESYKTVYQVPLTFNDLVVTSMVQGKKIMHLKDKPSFDYLPGETVIVDGGQTMVIDFPEADMQNPSQCIALTLDRTYVNQTIDFLNKTYNTTDERTIWELHFDRYHFENNNDVTSSLNKLIHICAGNDIAKNIYADLNLKELLIRLMQSQQLLYVSDQAAEANNSSRMHFVLHYIQQNLTSKISIDVLTRKAYLSRNAFFKWFKEQFGVTPLEYINQERIKLAKQLLIHRSNSISDVSLRCGFSDVNYFVRLFRKIEGVPPGVYQSMSY
ncbi:MAG TPA: AraC family transcriptional regulator [Flavipsychrobacter sp.]|nr:AraC family transcriptional regulator [Flavipsychrobacter sp.]